MDKKQDRLCIFGPYKLKKRVDIGEGVRALQPPPFNTPRLTVLGQIILLSNVFSKLVVPGFYHVT